MNPFNGLPPSQSIRNGVQAIPHNTVNSLNSRLFPYFNFIPTKPEIVQIDRRGEVLGRRCRLDLCICGDVSVTAEALLNMVQEKTDSEHLDASLKRHARDVRDMNAYMEGSDKESPIRPEQLTTALNKHAASDAVFTVDTGTPCIWSHD